MSTPLPEVTVTEALRRGDDGSALLLDVREAHEWRAGHAAAAVHAPLSSLDPGAVPTDRQVVAVCRSGNRSGQVTAALLARGVDVVNMAGGMLAWEAAGLPVVTDAGTPGQVV